MWSKSKVTERANERVWALVSFLPPVLLFSHIFHWSNCNVWETRLPEALASFPPITTNVTSLSFFTLFYLSFNCGHHFLLYVALPVGSPKINLSGPQEVHLCRLCNLYTKMQSCAGVLTPTGPVSVYSDVKKNISMGLYGFPGTK